MTTSEDRSSDTTPLAGRVDAPAGAAFASAADLAGAMRRASAAHGEHEKRIGAADPDWPDWYAAYMVSFSGIQDGTLTALRMTIVDMPRPTGPTDAQVRNLPG